MYWHQSHQLSPFKSIAPRHVAFTHDFAEILRRLFLLWRHNFVTWPDPTKFFQQKLRKGCPISYVKFQHDPPNGLASRSEKPMGGGVASTPPDRARVKWKCQTFCIWPDLWCHRWPRGQSFQLYLEDLVQASLLRLNFSSTSFGYRDRWGPLRPPPQGAGVGLGPAGRGLTHAQLFWSYECSLTYLRHYLTLSWGQTLSLNLKLFIYLHVSMSIDETHTMVPK